MNNNVENEIKNANAIVIIDYDFIKYYLKK
jgi:hypothetical protein